MPGDDGRAPPRRRGVGRPRGRRRALPVAAHVLADRPTRTPSAGASTARTSRRSRSKNLGNARAEPARADPRLDARTDATFGEDDAAQPGRRGPAAPRTTARRSPTAAPRSCSPRARFAAAWASAAAAPARAARSSAGAIAPPGCRSTPSSRAPSAARLLLPHVRRGVHRRAPPRRAAALEALDGIEVHDCFTITEYLAIDHLGLDARRARRGGRSRTARTSVGGALPINPSGGLIGGGHPVGATGVRMLLDAARQVTGRAGDYQVDGRRHVRDAQHRRQRHHRGELRRRHAIAGSLSSMHVRESSAAATSRLPADDDHPYRTGAWRPNFVEYDADDLDVVEGAIPADLDGRLPAQHREPAAAVDRPLPPVRRRRHAARDPVRRRHARYRNRFVRTRRARRRARGRRAAVGRHHRVARASRSATAGARAAA